LRRARLALAEQLLVRDNPVATANPAAAE